MKKQFLECGEIVSTHGLNGEVRVYPWCDGPEFLSSLKRVYLKKGEQAIRVERARPHKNLVVMKLAGVDTVEAASAMRKRILYVNREDTHLGENEYFIQDLIGARVVDVDTGEEYGVLTDIMQTGANDVYVLKNEATEYLVPAIPQVVLETDIEKDLIRIRPLPGLFDME